MRKIAILLMGVCFAFAANAQVQVKIHENAENQPVIHKEIYGQFAEHLGRCIYDGIWVGPDSDIPNINGYRKDLIEALQVLKVPVLRWPGGCCAEKYHWLDGVGEDRVPRMHFANDKNLLLFSVPKAEKRYPFRLRAYPRVCFRADSLSTPARRSLWAYSRIFVNSAPGVSPASIRSRPMT